jgi:hypothetical protein
VTTSPPAFYRHFWQASYDVWKRIYVHKGTAAPLVRCAVAKGVRGALDEFVNEFGFGRRQPRDWGRNEFAERQFNKSEMWAC